MSKIQTDIDQHEFQELTDVIIAGDSCKVRKILNDYDFTINVEKLDQNLLHLFCKEYEECYKEHFEIIYMLLDIGVNLENEDEKGNTCLFYAVENGNLNLVEILLQCGADMWASTEYGESIYDYVFEMDDSETHLLDAFQKFYPGLWKAVESEDIYQVRKLINLWCKTDLHVNDVSLKDAALETGNEEIISLILGISETMEMIYHIFAKNTKAVERMLTTCRKKLRLDLRKMSERGAPILYYLILSRDVAIIELFITHGCHVYTIMQDEFGHEMPVLFSALRPYMTVDVVEALLPRNKSQQEEMLYKILYKGKTVLEVALEQKVSSDIFDVLIDRSGPLLLCDRNQFNQTVRDLAIFENAQTYVGIIDKNVNLWTYDPLKYPERGKQLALYGWDFKTKNEKVCDETSNPSEAFFLNLHSYQKQIQNLFYSLEIGDVEKFTKLRVFSCESNLYENNLLWHARMVGDGMPLLHRAVLFNQQKLLEIILNEKPSNESIDTLFDQHHRTALHYAYGLSSTKEIKTMLLDYGCSEHMLDKTNKEPLDFKEKQDTPMMNELLERLRKKEYFRPEPNPWILTYEDCNEYDPCDEISSFDQDYFTSGTSDSHVCNDCELHKDYEDCDEQEDYTQTLCVIL